MHKKKIRFLFLSWRDIRHPKSGGAEVFTHEMLSNARHSSYDWVHFSPMFPKAKEQEIIDGILYIRKGNLFSVIWHAMRYYSKHQFDFVVDQCNTHQFFTPLWVPRRKRIFFIHQLTREIWFAEWNKLLGLIGYLLEPIALILHRRDWTITVSQSTKKDLLRLGFRKNRVQILPEGLSFTPWLKEEWKLKNSHPIFIYVGRFVSYKGIIDAVEAFGRFKKIYPNAKLWIVGKRDESFIRKKLVPIMNKYRLIDGTSGRDDITFYGYVSSQEKLLYMSHASIHLVPSLREGWGLTISEAAAVGTPSIVYPSPGCLDAVQHGETGFVCKQKSVHSLLHEMVNVVEHPKDYEEIRDRAWEATKNMKWVRTSDKFIEWIKKILPPHYESRID